MPVNRTAVRRRMSLRAFAVLCALALVWLLAASPAGASARAPGARHDDPVGLPLAGNPLASIADDGSDPSSGDSSDDGSSSDDTSDDGSSSDDSSDDDSSSDDSADDDSSDDDGSFEVTCDDSSDDDTTSSDDDSSGDDPSADTSDDDSANGDDSADDGTVCDDESDDDNTSTDDTADAAPKRAPRVSGLHASTGKHGVVSVSFRVDRAGRVTLTLQSLAAPAGVHGPKAASHTPKRRTRVVTLHGDDAIRAKAGINRTTFRRWNDHALAAGSYRLTATPSAKGGKPVETTFHVAAR